VPEKLYAGLWYQDKFTSIKCNRKGRCENLPVTIRGILKANLNLLRSKTLTIVRPLREPSRNTVVDTLEQLAVLVRRRNHEALVVTLLVAVAVCLDASGTFRYARHGDVEVVVAALARAAGLPVLDLPGPAFWDGDLAGDGAGHGGCGEEGEGGEGDHGCGLCVWVWWVGIRC